MPKQLGYQEILSPACVLKSSVTASHTIPNLTYSLRSLHAGQSGQLQLLLDSSQAISSVLAS